MKSLAPGHGPGAALGCLLLLLSACGFQPRGGAALPAAMDRTYLAVPATSRSLRRELERQLEPRGISLVPAPGPDAATLTVDGERLNRVVQSVGASARVREFALVYRVRLALANGAGEILLPARELELRRDYTFDRNQILGSTSEEALMEEELREAMVRRILAQLAAL